MTTRTRLRELLPSRRDLDDIRRAPRSDLLSGLTVAIVALPLALGFGAAAGMDPAAGLATAIVAGFVAAMLGGSNLQVSGPTGAMTVVLIPLVAQHGIGGVLMAGLMAGVLLIGLAVLRMGRFMRYVPAPVIEGFTLGIAIVIFLQQLPVAFGVPSDSHQVALAAIESFADFVMTPHWIDLALAAGVAAVMLIGARLRPGVPFSLLAVGVATFIAFTADFNVSLIGELPKTVPAPSLDFLNVEKLPGLITPAIAIAALAALESLLCATVADKMRGDQHHHPDRELFGQGIANLVSPLFGGMPATAAIARTAVNVRSGAASRMAAMWHAVILAGFLLVAAPLVGHIPLAALAGVLLATTIKMVNLAALTAMARSTRADGVVLVSTTVATVALDLVMGVLIGLALAGAVAVAKLATSLRLHIESPTAHDHHDERAGSLAEHVVVFNLHGPLFFAADHATLTESCQDTSVSAVVLHLRNVTTIDATGALALCDFVDRLARRGIDVYISGLRVDQHGTLTVLGVLDRVRTGDHLHGESEQAVAAAREQLRASGLL